MYQKMNQPSNKITYQLLPLSRRQSKSHQSFAQLFEKLLVSFRMHFPSFAPAKNEEEKEVETDPAAATHDDDDLSLSLSRERERFQQRSAFDSRE